MVIMGVFHVLVLGNSFRYVCLFVKHMIERVNKVPSSIYVCM